MKQLKTLSIPSILLAVAVLATGCHKTDNTDASTGATMGPAQAAGKAVDDAGANAAQATRDGAARADAAATQAGENARDAARRAGDNLTAAGQDAKQDIDKATDDAGKGVERAGQKMQDASK